MEELDRRFLSLKQKIALERGNKNGHFIYSAKVRTAVIDLVTSVGSQSECAKRLGLSQSSVCKWLSQSQKSLKPRRLTVSDQADKCVSLARESSRDSKFEAVLPNGVVIRGFSLTAESLRILGGSK